MTELSKAVFLSYASQDATAAHRWRRLCVLGGVEVWLDTTGLRGGDAWDQKIKKQIRDCALFLPIISVTTQRKGIFAESGGKRSTARMTWRVARPFCFR